MAETVRNAYRRLFQIRLLHHYWLDEGATVFDLIPSQADRDERLLSYDMRPFLALRPTEATGQALKGMGLVYKEIASGCIVAAPEGGCRPSARFLWPAPRPDRQEGRWPAGPPGWQRPAGLTYPLRWLASWAASGAA